MAGPRTLGQRDLADPAIAGVRVTEPKAARTVGLAWLETGQAMGPVCAFRDFALGYEGRLLN